MSSRVLKIAPIFLSLVLLWGCSAESRAAVASTTDIATYLTGENPSQAALKDALDELRLGDRPATQQQSELIAEFAERAIVNVLARYQAPDVDLSYRTEFKREISAILTSEHGELRQALAAFLRAPHQPDVLAPFAADASFEGVRRLAIFSHLIAPQEAILLYARADEIQPDAFCTFQQSDLNHVMGRDAIARNLVAVARQRWPTDQRVQAIALVKDAYLDGASGLYAERHEKLKRALDLNLQINRLDAAASTLIALGDQRTPVAQDGEMFVTVDTFAAMDMLRRARDLALTIESDMLLSDASARLANIAAVSDVFGGRDVAEDYRKEALEAAMRFGDLHRAAEIAKTATLLHVADRRFELAQHYADRLELIGFQLSEPGTVVSARIQQSEIRMGQGDHAGADLILTRTWGIGEFARLGRESLAFGRGRIAQDQGDAAAACRHYSFAHDGYVNQGYAEGATMTEELMHAASCPN